MSAYAVAALTTSLAIARGAALHGPAGASAPGVVVGVGLVALAAACVTGGLHRVAHAIVHRDEPGIASLFRATRRELIQWIGLWLVEAVVALACLLNIWFYLRWRSHVGMVLAVAFGYALAMWLVTCIYHWPLLIAAQAGLIPPECDRGPSLRAVFRNSVVLFVAAPRYATGLAGLVVGLAAPLVASGIGLMLVAPALTSILGTQAVRDHLVRLGSLSPPDEGPAPPDQWRVPDAEGRPVGPPS